VHDLPIAFPIPKKKEEEENALEHDGAKSTYPRGGVGEKSSVVSNY
jgi:hypothetical protein